MSTMRPPGPANQSRTPNVTAPGHSRNRSTTAARPWSRKRRVKGARSDVWEPSTGRDTRPDRGFPLSVSSESRLSPRELTMADVAFVVTTIAVFALVALVAKGVTKL